VFGNIEATPLAGSRRGDVKKIAFLYSCRPNILENVIYVSGNDILENVIYVSGNALLLT